MAHERYEYERDGGCLPAAGIVLLAVILVLNRSELDSKKFKDPDTYQEHLEKNCPEALQVPTTVTPEEALKIAEEATITSRDIRTIPYSLAEINASLVTLENMGVNEGLEVIHKQKLEDLRVAGVKACEAEHEAYGELRYQELLLKGTSE